MWNFKRAGISRLLKEKGREQFWPKKSNLHRTRKNGENFTPIRVIRIISHCYAKTREVGDRHWMSNKCGKFEYTYGRIRLG
jgi:hypothetical protein